MRVYILNVSVLGQFALAVFLLMSADVIMLGLPNEHHVSSKIAWVAAAIVLLLLGVGAFINGVRIIIARFMLTFGFRR